MVASTKIHSDNRVSVDTQVHLQDLKRHIVVVHLVVAESNVNVDGMEVLVLHEQLFVDLSSFFKVTSEVVEGGHAELIFDIVRQAAMKVHDLSFLAKLLG